MLDLEKKKNTGRVSSYSTVSVPPSCGRTHSLLICFTVKTTEVTLFIGRQDPSSVLHVEHGVYVYVAGAEDVFHLGGVVALKRGEEPGLHSVVCFLSVWRRSVKQTPLTIYREG